MSDRERVEKAQRANKLALQLALQALDEALPIAVVALEVALVDMLVALYSSEIESVVKHVRIFADSLEEKDGREMLLSTAADFHAFRQSKAGGKS